MYEYGSALIAAKRARPTDDMLSAVVHATLPDLDPPALSDAELYGFFVLLFSAGSDTTRNAIAAGLLPLAEQPEHWAALRLCGPCPEHRLTYRGVIPDPSGDPPEVRPARRRG